MKKVLGTLTAAVKTRIETFMRCSKSYKDGLDRDLDEKLVDDSSLHFSDIDNLIRGPLEI